MKKIFFLFAIFSILFGNQFLYASDAKLRIIKAPPEHPIQRIKPILSAAIKLVPIDSLPKNTIDERADIVEMDSAQSEVKKDNDGVPSIELVRTPIPKIYVPQKENESIPLQFCRTISQWSVIAWNGKEETLLWTSQEESEIGTVAVVSILPIPGKPIELRHGDMEPLLLIPDEIRKIRGDNSSVSPSAASVWAQNEGYSDPYAIAAYQAKNIEELENAANSFLADIYKGEGASIQIDSQMGKLFADYFERGYSYFIFDVIECRKHYHKSPICVKFESNAVYYPTIIGAYGNSRQTRIYSTVLTQQTLDCFTGLQSGNGLRDYEIYIPEKHPVSISQNLFDQFQFDIAKEMFTNFPITARQFIVSGAVDKFSGDIFVNTSDISNCNQFAIDLYKQIPFDSSQDGLFISPTSVRTLLAMIWEGSTGNIKQEIQQVSRLNSNEQFSSNDSLLTANGLWIQNQFPVFPNFMKKLRENYHADIFSLDFNSLQAKDQINSWIAEKTKDNITNLFESIDPSTKLILANAVYFKKDWALPFHENETKKEPFHLNSTKEVSVFMMNRTLDVPYAALANCQVVEIPYENQTTSMILILPNENHFETFHKTISAELVITALNSMKSQRVVLKIPRFELRSRPEIQSVLEKLGIRSIFGSIEIPNITNVKPLEIKMVHEAMIQIDEKGTTAAAVTDATAKPMMYHPPKKNTFFHADHPFFFLIRDTKSGDILFMGHVLSPK